jgi:hypothetical protein
MKAVHVPHEMVKVDLQLIDCHAARTSDKVTIDVAEAPKCGIFDRSGDSNSQLTQVFGRLLYERRLGEEALGGLREDKLKPIRSFAKFLAEDAAA